MKEAIDNGFLCRYRYFPHVVRLNEDEMAEYKKISLQLAKFYNIDEGSFSGVDDILMRLLLKCILGIAPKELHNSLVSFIVKLTFGGGR